MNRQHVIIVGAGASGLMIASELAEHCNITILEIREVTGGRVKTIKHEAAGHIIECGAEFVHGDTPVTKELLAQANLQPVKLTGKMFRKGDGRWEEESDMIEGWDELVGKMKGQRDDVTMQQFLDENYPKDKYAELREHVRAFVEGFDVAAVDEVSVQSLYREWSNEGEQFRLQNGYAALIDHLERKCRDKGCNIITGEVVKRINWKANEVSVQTASGKIYVGNRVVVTVPVSVWRDTVGTASIHFSPAIDDHMDAAKSIGFGTVIKVILHLKEKIWPEKTGFIFSKEIIPTWWTQYPVDNNLITGWVGGPAAARISQHTDSELLNMAVASLTNIFDLRNADDLRNIIYKSYVFNWSKFDESLGAYSFSKPESKSARKLLNTPLADTVYFSGEGLYDGPFSGTVEAALSSGRITAAGLLKQL